VTPSSPSAVDLLRIEERLRQERETFDQRKEQEAKWFSLRIRMGYIAALMLPSVAMVAGYVLLNSSTFDDGVVTAAGSALFIDVLGLIAAVWKVVLNPAYVTKLEPVITEEQINGYRTRENED